MAERGLEVAVGEAEEPDFGWADLEYGKTEVNMAAEDLLIESEHQSRRSRVL